MNEKAMSLIETIVGIYLRIKLTDDEMDSTSDGEYLDEFYSAIEKFVKEIMY